MSPLRRARIVLVYNPPVSADIRQRFFVTQAAPSPPSPPVTDIRLVQTCLEEVEAKMPAAR